MRVRRCGRRRVCHFGSGLRLLSRARRLLCSWRDRIDFAGDRNRSRPHRFRGRLPNWRAAIGIAAFFSPMIAVSIYGLLYPQIVLAEAERLAGDAPFCISSQDPRRPVQSRQDLTFFTMYGGRRKHATLLVGRTAERKKYHWSYRQQRFVDESLYGATPCLPRKDLAALLQHWKRAEHHGYELYLGGRDLQIPAEYEPRFTDNYLSISAAAPDFGPIGRSPLSPHASASLESRAWLEGAARNVLKEAPTGRFADLVELRDGPDGFDWYYKLDAQGQISTLIDCRAQGIPGRACQHYFYRDGAIYKFRHSRELLASSNEMEERLFALFSSFDNSSADRR